jgi:iodotyrosine deiodinase
VDFMTTAKYTLLKNYTEYPVVKMKQRIATFYTDMKRRRTVRDFSNRPVPREVIEDCIRVAATAPSGANLQPWHFVVVSDTSIKRRIREVAEKKEYEFYSNNKTQEWVKDLELLGTDEHKPFLEIAPYLIVIFAQRFGLDSNGNKKKRYYVTESVGIATGLLISAVHYAGLVSLTYTPSQMSSLNKILSRPPNEKPFLILVVGYPAKEAHVPEIRKKSLKDIASFI